MWSMSERPIIMVLALDATTGDIGCGLRRSKQDTASGARPRIAAAYSTSPRWIARLHALDAADRPELWNTEFEGAIASQPVLNDRPGLCR